MQYLIILNRVITALDFISLCGITQVVVTDKNNPKSKFYFPCGQWLAKDEGDGTTYRDLLGSKDPLAVRKGKDSS